MPFHSSGRSRFNADMGATIDGDEQFGISVFLHDDADAVYRTYHTTGRGLEPAGFRQMLDPEGTRMPSTVQLVEANGVRLCVETFGDPTNPAVLLIHGACASMLWWDRELCERIAAHGRLVIRYDNRDTGRSIRYPPGRPGYTLTDMTRDAIGILDVFGIERAHIVGRSMAGAIALIAGVDHPARVASLTFVGTTPGGDDLPPMSDAVLARGSGAPDFSDTTAVVNYGVELMRAYVGESPFFDEAAVRELAEQDVARTGNMASAFTNHFAIDFDGPVSGGLGDIVAPTLVVHGDLDPVFPLPHARALCAAVPGAELLVLQNTGHDLPPQRYATFVEALVRHTGARPVTRWPTTNNAAESPTG